MSDALGSIPFASLIAALLCWLGVALFCAMEYQAINASVEQMHRFFEPNIPWLDNIQIIFILVAASMCLVALVLLIVGALATGSTRKRVYSGWRARLGGRLSCAAFMVLSYLLHLLWMALFAVAVVFLFCYAVAAQLCSRVSGFGDADCLNFTLFQPLLPERGGHAEILTSSGQSSGGLGVCGVNLAQFCTLTDTALTWYLIGALACVVVVMSLVHFLIVMSANYAHIKDGSKYMELQEIWQYEENEMSGLPPHMRYRTNGVSAPKF